MIEKNNLLQYKHLLGLFSCMKPQALC
uniref:Uncharacterized protein n=1 Tax=Anguilla anguilla TaxID=7936 RepID=A0A0E9R9G2_ANGAN